MPSTVLPAEPPARRWSRAGAALELQRVVDGGPGVFQIGKHITDSLAQAGGCVVAVGGGHGFDDGAVQRVVQLEDATG